MHSPREQTALVPLRLLATTDLHAHLLGWDYHADRASPATGFARIATLIRQARAEVPNALYFDNGDLIEGSPLAEYIGQKAGKTGPRARAGGDVDRRMHPMVAALHALGCDAAALGNHEFSFGLPFLTQVVAQAPFPMLSANILRADAAPLFQPWALLSRRLTDTHGQAHDLRIGVFGLTPPQVLEWERTHLPPDLQARDICSAAQTAISALQAAGADLIIAMAHSGIGAAGAPQAAENAGWQLATLPGLDVLILGHEHLVQAAPLQGVPAVIAGAYGSHLGLIDLELERGPRGWCVRSARPHLRATARRDPQGHAEPLVPEDAAIVAQSKGVHAATRRWMARQIGQTDIALHSYFAVLQPGAMQALIAEAQADHLRDLIKGTAWADLPVLSSVAPFKAGGRGGPGHFTAVPPGPILMRHAADLYMHPNRFAAIEVTGADLRDWLEISASSYALMQPGLQDQPLLDPDFPATCLEMIAGLTYRIDLTAPARHGIRSTRPQAGPGRIRDLCHQGRPLTDDMRFVLATNSHRLGIVGGRWQRGLQMVADPCALATREVLIRYLAAGHDLSGLPPLSWGFVAMPGTSMVLDTAIAASRHIEEIRAFHPESLGLTAEGFLRFRLQM
ncbi:MAG: 5'-nucleotidase C-terminal domain-containing protein [Rhodobacteraceae bacterium]|nr:5'-nucleotidase C-terminal domain-containing protein [Paracoccaceae bacterium]